MPAMLNEEDYDRWLDPGITDPEQVMDCLKPFDLKLMKKYPVSDRANRAENDDAVCAEEIPKEISLEIGRPSTQSLTKRTMPLSRASTREVAGRAADPGRWQESFRLRGLQFETVRTAPSSQYRGGILTGSKYRRSLRRELFAIQTV